jgi:8-oxo-dGTP pyrophosphatase MutT (NUDIX family)
VNERAEEPLNVYDAHGRAVGVKPRGEAKRSGLALGAVNVLLVSGRGEVLLQKRPDDVENGGRWDKSVGGHVGAGEDFDRTAVREAGEELFGDPASPRVVLAESAESFADRLATLDLGRSVLFQRAGLQLGLRDVRHDPGGGIRTIVYHVAVYLGRTDVPIEGFSPPAGEIAGLAYFDAAQLDRMLASCALAPNMAFVWLAHGRALLALAGAA